MQNSFETSKVIENLSGAVYQLAGTIRQLEQVAVKGSGPYLADAYEATRKNLTRVQEEIAWLLDASPEASS